MRIIRYIGNDAICKAFYKQTGITWTTGMTATVLDDKVAAEMLKHPTVFVDASNASDPVSAQAAAIAAVDGRVAVKPRTVVVFGSSNGAGMGASTYSGDPSSTNGWASPATSWAGLLASALGPTWSVINRSLSGTGVAAGVARFWTDVYPHKPSHVIICNHPQNDSFDFRSILLNTKTLIRWCEQIGAIPVLRGAYMHPSMTATQYAQSLAFNEQLDALGYHRIDHMSAMDSGNGSFVGGATYHIGDGLHPNDLGYAKLFGMIDLGIFRHGQRTIPRPTQYGAWRVNELASDGSAIKVQLRNESGTAEPIHSWTMRARVKGFVNGGLVAKAILAAHVNSDGSDTAWRLRNPSGTLELVSPGANETVASSVTLHDNTNVRDLVIRYNGTTKTIGFFIDGARVASDVVLAADLPPRSVFVFGGRADQAGNAKGFSFSDLALWNVPLSDAVISDMAASKRIQTGGLLFASDLGVTPRAGATVPNIVPNGVIAEIGTAVWERAAAY